MGEPNGPAPSQRDIAKLLKVSPNTVSLALKDDPRISKEMRDRVREAADKLGYTPNAAYRVLADRRWKDTAPKAMTVALELCEGDRQSEKNCGSLEPELRRRGYAMERFGLGPSLSAARLAQILRARGVEGIFCRAVRSEEDLDQYARAGLTVVAMSQRMPSAKFHAIDFDTRMGITLCFERAIAAGYRRIGAALISSPSEVDDGGRIGAVLDVQRRHPELAPVPLFLADNIGHSWDQLANWVRRRRLDCVVGFNDAIYWDLRSHGFEIGSEIGYIGLMHEETEPGTVARLGYNEIEMARQAVSLMDTLLRQGARGYPEHPVKVMVPVRFCEGKSLPQRDVPPISTTGTEGLGPRTYEIGVVSVRG